MGNREWIDNLAIVIDRCVAFAKSLLLAIVLAIVPALID
jgi:hypothetical protein